jgi:hypothetical protein
MITSHYELIYCISSFHNTSRWLAQVSQREPTVASFVVRLQECDKGSVRLVHFFLLRIWDGEVQAMQM